MKLILRRENPIHMRNLYGNSLAGIASLIIELPNSDSRVNYDDLQEGDPTRQRPDIPSARGTIEQEPGVQRKKRLKQTIEYFKRAQS